MLVAGIPAKFPMPFAKNAAGGTIRNIPSASQIGIVAGAASLNDGFPVQTSLPVGAGGTPPSIADMNGILNEVTAWNQWQQAGGPIYYDSAFQTAIGGYPAGAMIASAAHPGGFYGSTIDNNVSALVDNGTTQTNWTYYFLASSSTVLFFPPQVTFYVNFATGNDSTGNGLTTGTAWATIQHAVNAIASAYVYFGVITIQCANGTLTLGAAGWAAQVPASQISGWYIVGNTASPASCVINGSATGARGFGCSGKVNLTVSGFAITSNLEGVVSNYGSDVGVGNVTLASSSGNGNAIGSYNSSLLYFLSGSSVTISGSWSCAFTCTGGAILQIGYHDVNVTNTVNVTFSGTPSFSAACAVTTAAGTIYYDPVAATFGGSATGMRYSAASNGVILTSGSGGNVFPGSIAGITPTGGQYL